MTAHATPAIQDEDSAWTRWGERTYFFWTIVLYGAIALCTYDTYRTQPDLLRGWPGVGLLALIVAFCAEYHFVLMRYYKHWPMPLQRALLYFGGQAIILALLSGYNVSFAGLGFALLAHVTSVLPPRFWPPPMLALLAVMFYRFGLYDDWLQGNWADAAWSLFRVLIFIALFVLVSTLVQQRFRLVCAVRELRQAKADLEASAAQAEELAALRERTRLARDMHDNIGHALVVVNVKLEAAQRLYAKDSTRGDAELEATRALVRDTMAGLRRSLADLRAPLPDHLDLPRALQRIAEDVQKRSPLHIRCVVAPNVPQLVPEAADALRLVAREALTNVERHAGADAVNIDLERQNGSLVLRVADNGAGMAPSALRQPGHFGIIGMRERVEALGGTLHIVQPAAGGTIVEASMPVSRHTAEQRVAGEA